MSSRRDKLDGFALAKHFFGFACEMTALSRQEKLDGFDEVETFSRKRNIAPLLFPLIAETLTALPQGELPRSG